MPNIKVAEVLGGGVANVDKKEVADRTQADTNFLHGDGVFPVRDANGLLNAENAKVQAQSPAAMAVDVLDGLALVDGFTLGNRTVGGSVAASVAVTAADPTNPRIDIVVVSPPDNGSGNRVNSGEFKNATFEVIAGTPAATPVAPSAPDGKILLAKVTVGAGATTITDADINNDCKDYLCDIDDMKDEYRKGLRERTRVDRRQSLKIRDLCARVAILEAMTGGGEGIRTEIVPLPASSDDSIWDNAGATNIEQVGDFFKLTSAVTPGTTETMVDEDFEDIGNGTPTDWTYADFSQAQIGDKTVTGGAPSGATNDAITFNAAWNDPWAPFYNAVLEYSTPSGGGTLPTGITTASDMELSYVTQLTVDRTDGGNGHDAEMNNNCFLFTNGGHLGVSIWSYRNTFGDRYTQIWVGGGYFNGQYQGFAGADASREVYDNSADWLWNGNPLTVTAKISPSSGTIELTVTDGANSLYAATSYPPPTLVPGGADVENVGFSVDAFGVTYRHDGEPPALLGNSWHDDVTAVFSEPDTFAYAASGSITSKPITAVDNMVTASMTGVIIDRQSPSGTPYGTVTLEYSTDNGASWATWDDTRNLSLDFGPEYYDNWVRVMDADELPATVATPTYLFRISMTSAAGTNTPCVGELYAGSDNSVAQADNQLVKAKINEIIATNPGWGLAQLQIP